MRSGFVTIALSVSLAAAAHAADDIVRTLDQQATAAYKAKDYAGFLKASRALQEAIPWSLRARYNLACGYALTGAPADALRTLLFGELRRLRAAQELMADVLAGASQPALTGPADFAHAPAALQHAATAHDGEQREQEG